MNTDVHDAAQLKSIIAGLERSSRYIVLMYYADELRPEEIGLVLDMPQHQVQAVLDAFRLEVGQQLASAAG